MPTTSVLPGEAASRTDTLIFYGGFILLALLVTFFIWWSRAIRRK